jgi:hypothetical protein
MDIKPKYWYIFSISFIVMLIITVLVIDQHKNKIHELIEKKSSIDDKIYRIKPSHGASYVELKSGRKVLIPQLILLYQIKFSYNIYQYLLVVFDV